MSSDRVYPWSNKFDKALVRARYRFAKRVVKTLASSKTVLNILDVGTGYGVGLQEILNRGVRIVAIDIDEKCIKYVYNNLDSTVLDVAVCDAMLLPFRPRLFHAVLIMDVIEHVTNPERLLRESCRVTKSSGLLILSTPNKNVVKHNPHHVREFSVKELVKLIRKTCTCKIIGLFGQVPVNKLLSILSKVLRIDFVAKFVKLLPNYETCNIEDFLSENELVNLLACEVYRCGIIRDFAHVVAVVLVS